MAQSVAIKDTESIGIIEVMGAINLARLLQSIGVETRARIVGATEASGAASVTVVIAGGLAEVQHASSHVKSLVGISDSVFFAKPDSSMVEVLLKSLKLSAAPVKSGVGEAQWKQRVREIDELDVTEIQKWNVHELRRYARSIHHFPLKGRSISKANRAELLALLMPKNPTSIVFESTQQLPN